MTETGSRSRRSASLTTRLAAAFAGVALLAVALVVALMVVSTSKETATLAASERQRSADGAAQAAGAAYARSGGWSDADLAAAQRVAAQAGGRLTVVGADGAVVIAGGPGRGAGQGAAGGGNASTATVRVAGRSVGEVTLRVPGSGLSQAEQRLRDRLVAIALAGGAIAVLLALGAALLLSRRLTSPLRRLTAAAHELEGGDLGARSGAQDAPGEIGELAGAFDRLALTLADQSRSRRTLLAEIAHELRTPLAILRGNCEAMVDGIEPPTPERLSSLHDEVLRLEGLVADLETLADSEAAALELDLAPVDLADVARDAIALLGARAAAAGITLTADLEPGVVPGDRARLAQVLQNLLSNALKFTAAGGTVTVTVRSADGVAQIDVADTGRGIPPEELPHVFERRWRGRAAADVSGRGIGLAVVDELVRAHGGTVTASSEPGRGSRFTARIPAAR